MELDVRFGGGLAGRENKIPAYDGMISLQGITRSVLIISNYVVEGRVRRRDFGQVPLQFNLLANRPGSFDTLFEIVWQGAGVVAATLGPAMAANLLTDLLKYGYYRLTGVERRDPESVQRLEESRGGDLQALVEAIEPSVRGAHTIINHGVVNINITSGETNIAKLDRRTKEYVWDSAINNRVRAKLFSVASFNANTGGGRAYDTEERRTIPFELVNEADRASVNALLRSISSYTIKRRLGDDLASAVALQYTSVDAVDGRIKKIRVHKARANVQEL